MCLSVNWVNTFRYNLIVTIKKTYSQKNINITLFYKLFVLEKYNFVQYFHSKLFFWNTQLSNMTQIFFTCFNGDKKIYVLKKKNHGDRDDFRKKKQKQNIELVNGSVKLVS